MDIQEFAEDDCDDKQEIIDALMVENDLLKERIEELENDIDFYTIEACKAKDKWINELLIKIEELEKKLKAAEFIIKQVNAMARGVLQIKENKNEKFPTTEKLR